MGSGQCVANATLERGGRGELLVPGSCRLGCRGKFAEEAAVEGAEVRGVLLGHCFLCFWLGGRFIICVGGGLRPWSLFRTRKWGEERL